MFKKLAAVAAASTLVFASTAAQAGAASSLSLRNAPAAEARANTAGAKQSNIVPGTPLFAILGIIGIVAVLEVTGAINIFGGDDEPDSN
jgi:hypothetical protein